MDVLIGYHRHLVEGWLLIMGVNLLLPYLLRRDTVRRVFYTRVGYFLFWAFWAMVAFSGLMVWLFAGRPHTLPVDLMIFLIVVLPVLDAYRAIRLRRIWLEGNDGIGFSMAVVAVEIALTVLVTVLAFAR